MRRPTSLTVISWIFIVVGVISIVFTTSAIDNPMAEEIMRKSPVPIPIQFFISYMSTIVLIASGIATLLGRSWGRVLYVAWNLFLVAVGFAISFMTMAAIPGLVAFLIASLILFRPNATKYFESKVPVYFMPPPESANDR